MRDIVGAIKLGDPIKHDHPLNRGLLWHFLALPGTVYSNSNRWRDLARHPRFPRGTLTSGPLWSGITHPGGRGSVKYDGTDDYVDVGDVTDLDGLTDMAFSLWFNLDDVTGTHGIIGKQSASVGPIMFSNGTSLVWQVGSGTDRVTVSSALAANTWYHVVGNSLNSTLQVFKNGLQVGGTDTVGANTNHAVTLKIGLNNDGGVGRMKGYIDDVRIYNRGLTATEVWALYNESRYGYPTALARRSPLRTIYIGPQGGGGGGTMFDVIGGGVGKFVIAD